MKFKILILSVFLLAQNVQSQNGFQILNNKKKVVLPFKLINNLIFIPITINGIELNFMLDSGSSETILFSLEDTDAVQFQNVEKVKLKGFGNNNFVDGLKSSNNYLKIKNFEDKNHTIYIVLDQEFNLSSQVGIPVNGIIGYHFFQNYLIETNYDKRKIFIYQENPKIRKKLAKQFSKSEISLENNKPYFQQSTLINNNAIQPKLLIDSGSSDALWLFENQLNKIKVPTKSFDDYLGRGFSGAIYGKRARIEKFSINNEEFIKPLVAFPDSLSVQSSNIISNREGSVGGEILKRFTIFYDYPNGKIYFRKNSNFDLPFNFNMSGIDLQHDGLQWVQEKVDINKSTSNTITFDLSSDKQVNFKYKFSLKPSYKIYSLRKNSPAEKCGLLVDDIIISINKVNIYNYSLQQIQDLLKSEEGKKIRIEVDRKGKIMEFNFKLEAMI